MLETPNDFAPLKTLAANHARLQQAKRAADAELRQLDVELAKAVESDRRTFAARLAKDVAAKDPGPKEEAKVRGQIEAAQTRRRALVTAVEDAELAVRDEIRTHRDKWLATEAAAAEKARRAYAEAIETLAVKGAEMAARRNLVRWLETPGRPFKEIPPTVHSRILLKPNGNPLEFAKLVDALRQDAQPPDERESLESKWRFGPFKQPPPEPQPEPELDRVA